MRKILLALAIASLPMHTSLSHAEDTASKAESWGLVGEKNARFSAKVVDIMCELTGNCAEKCGAGSYQIGLLTTDGKVIPAMKNGQPAFNGAVVDLLPFCGQNVEVDGLFVGEDIPAQLYQVQLIKPEGGEWQKTDLHTKEWDRLNANLPGEGPWFRRDPRVLSEIAKDGYLGLGAAEDEKYIKENL
ncbi:MAG: hypothetical protein H2045_03400 [Rhizobiales bacterium]|nr:hypothetical protein [Hyphomicrobiales bacterium]